MKKLLIVLALCILVCGCVNSKKEESLDSIIKSGNYTIVDVRTIPEYKGGHVKGSINIPYEKIDKTVNLDKSKKILVYCHSGRRSEIAYKKLTELGYDVIDLGAYDSIDLEKE